MTPSAAVTTASVEVGDLVEVDRRPAPYTGVVERLSASGRMAFVRMNDGTLVQVGVRWLSRA